MENEYVRLGELSRLSPKCGEVLVLHSSRSLSSADAELIQGYLKSAFPENSVIVLDEGFRLSVAGSGMAKE